MNITDTYKKIKDNFLVDAKVNDLLNKYKYYKTDIECYALFEGDRTCLLCKAVKPLLYKNCKIDSKVWGFLDRSIDLYLLEAKCFCKGED